MNREDALNLLNEYTKNPNLIKHALAVESAMIYYAELFGEDKEEWGMAGLLHDFDYEKYPQAPDHPVKGSEILKEKGYPESIRNAILGHADYTGVPRDTKMAKTLFAVDELCGFIVAVALVRPNKNIEEVEVKSVKKKMKDKAFAKQVSRDEITKGAEEIDINLDEHIQNCINALKNISDDLGL
ncbi:HDIG domain-containing protein [Patescibacteria group bacterium]|nr:HDIG domain-containing protein [Patescibacteria group bacterium]MBU1890917.1 HDIG domain-containing protein [Patescibacteria group bacterium]